MHRGLDRAVRGCALYGGAVDGHPGAVQRGAAPLLSLRCCFILFNFLKTEASVIIVIILLIIVFITILFYNFSIYLIN